MRKLFCLLLLTVTPISAITPHPPQSQPASLQIDHAFPGGNIVMAKSEGDDVYLHQDLRDTKGDWFYWYFRIHGAQNRKLTFHFTKSRAIGPLGPAVSRDDGVTWRWLGRRDSANSFQYEFTPTDTAVRFAFAVPYVEGNLRRFLSQYKDNPHLRADTLTNSRKGRPVERLHLGCLSGSPAFRVAVFGRHHACESMASYVVEGLMQETLADSDTGDWLRKNVELLVIPFVDKDGVEDGDQGKNRVPHDHKADYRGDSIYPETAAIRRYLPEWSKGVPLVNLDMHDPALNSQFIYTHALREDTASARRARQFMETLEKVRKGPLDFRVKDSEDFAQAKRADKAPKNRDAEGSGAPSANGVSCSIGFEFPYASVRGVEVNPATARAFGQDIARALHIWLKQKRSAP